MMNTNSYFEMFERIDKDLRDRGYDTTNRQNRIYIGFVVNHCLNHPFEKDQVLTDIVADYIEGGIEALHESSSATDS